MQISTQSNKLRYKKREKKNVLLFIVDRIIGRVERNVKEKIHAGGYAKG